MKRKTKNIYECDIDKFINRIVKATKDGWEIGENKVDIDEEDQICDYRLKLTKPAAEAPTNTNVFISEDPNYIEL